MKPCATTINSTVLESLICGEKLPVLLKQDAPTSKMAQMKDTSHYYPLSTSKEWALMKCLIGSQIPRPLVYSLWTGHMVFK